MLCWDCMVGSLVQDVRVRNLRCGGGVESCASPSGCWGDMAGEFFSASWYRVERLKPAVAQSCRTGAPPVSRTDLVCPAGSRVGAVSSVCPAAYHLIGLMDGRHSVRAIWGIRDGDAGRRGAESG